MMTKKILIPNIECMEEDEYRELLSVLKSMPIEFEILEQIEE